MGDHFIPAVLKHVLELDRMLGAYSPAGGAPGATRHVMKQRLNAAVFFGFKRPRRAVLNTGKTPIAFLIHLEVDHCPCPLSERRRILLEIASAARLVSIAMTGSFSALMLGVNPTTQTTDICGPVLWMSAATARTP